jgi:hypothetical protein
MGDDVATGWRSIGLDRPEHTVTASWPVRCRPQPPRRSGVAPGRLPGGARGAERHPGSSPADARAGSPGGGAQLLRDREGHRLDGTTERGPRAPRKGTRAASLAGGTQPKDVAEVLVRMGSAHTDLGEDERALAPFGEAEAIALALPGQPRLADALIGKGIARWGLARYDPAIEVPEQAVRILETRKSRRAACLAAAYVDLGVVYWSKSDTPRRSSTTRRRCRSRWRHTLALETRPRPAGVDPSGPPSVPALVGLWRDGGRRSPQVARSRHPGGDAGGVAILQEVRLHVLRRVPYEGALPLRRRTRGAGLETPIGHSLCGGDGRMGFRRHRNRRKPSAPSRHLKVGSESPCDAGSQ